MPTTPAHTLIRVRNNQRRHRARRREYITSLEQKLAESELLLKQARAEIAMLRSKLALHICQDERAALENRRKTLVVHDSSVAICSSKVQAVAVTDSIPVSPSTTIPSSLSNGSVNHHVCSAHPPSPKPNHLSGPKTLDSSSESSRETPLPPILPEYSFLPQKCETVLALASAGESTTLCSKANTLIGQQNFRGLGADAITGWLYPSFREGKNQEEGCRVENRALFEVLDFLSS